MTAPTINLTPPRAKGNLIDFAGQVDFAGGTGTVEFFLDPQPSGTSLGPFPLTPAGIQIANTLAIGNGHWKLRVVATPSAGSPVSQVTPDIVINRATAKVAVPLLDGSRPPIVDNSTVILDPALHVLYAAAIAGAASGAKRLAAAQAVVTAFGTKQLLEIFTNGKRVVRCEYNGAMTITNDADGVKIHTGTPVPTTVLATANLSIGKSIFTLQGGNGYATQMLGTVGAISSGKSIILTGNPISGYDFTSSFDFLLPPEIESQ